MIKSIKKTRNVVALFKGNKLHATVKSPTGTTFYDDSIYTAIEYDTIDEALQGRVKPSGEELRDLMYDEPEAEVERVRVKFGVAKAGVAQ